MIALNQDTQPVGRGPLLASTLVVLAVIGLSVLAVLGSLHGLRGRVRSETEVGAPWMHVPPRAATLDLRLFGKEHHPLGDQARLFRYGWVDREKRLIHVPVEVAIELYLESARSRP